MGNFNLGKALNKQNDRLYSEAPGLLWSPGVAGDSRDLRNLLHRRVPGEAGGGQDILEGGGPGAGTLFDCHQLIVNYTFYFLGDLLRRVNSRDRCRLDSLHIPDSEQYQR